MPRLRRDVPLRLIVTCEHGGNRVPRPFQYLFVGKKRLLAGHRGYDPGALELAREIARHFHAPLIASTTTRLFVELNRTPGHRQLFSEITRSLDNATRRHILLRYYSPYQRRVEKGIRQLLLRPRPVLHISAHSFTPVRNGKRRKADIGLLYDPQRPLERELCEKWKGALAHLVPGVVVRRNYPYLGISFGLTTRLRALFPPHRYLGIELEVNQRWPRGRKARWRGLRSSLVASLEIALQNAELDR